MVAPSMSAFVSAHERPAADAISMRESRAQWVVVAHCSICLLLSPLFAGG